MSRGWTAAVAAALLATVFARQSSAPPLPTPTKLMVGSATVAPGGQVTISVTAGNASDIGSFRVDVQYDGTRSALIARHRAVRDLLRRHHCRGHRPHQRKPGGGIPSNPAVLGTITFTAGSTLGVADLDVNADTYLLTDTVGEDIDVAATGGAITIAQPTPSPTSVPECHGGTDRDPEDAALDGWSPRG